MNQWTQEEKDLLLHDLCARLPYGVMVECSISSGEVMDCILMPKHIEELINSTLIVKPYLRPMSSMTNEEKKELKILCEKDLSEFAGFIINGHGLSHDGLYMFDKCRQLNFCLSHHFDFRGLIPKGLALAASKDIT